jgi:hypothetical protein
MGTGFGIETLMNPLMILLNSLLGKLKQLTVEDMKEDSPTG